MSYCLNCGKENPPSKGPKKRKYCSHRCANKYYQKEGRYNKHKGEKSKLKNPNWGMLTIKKLDSRATEVQKRKQAYEWHCKHMYSPRQIEEEYGMLAATAWHKAQAFGIKGKIIYWKNKKLFFTYEEVQRILNEKITPDHDNEYLRKIRTAAIVRGKKYRQRPEVKAHYAKYRRERCKNDPAYRLRRNVGALVYDAIVLKQGKTKGGSTFAHLPYTPKHLKEHLEKQFTEGMTWDNYGEWHLDHIVPQAALPYDSLVHPNFQKCWALSNLQPLWAKDNMAKSSFHEGKRYHYI